MSAIERYVVPATLEEAAETLRDGEVTVLAGGTDLMPQSQAGRVKFRRTLMNVRRVAELRGVTQAGGEIRIGALTTIAELLRDPLIERHLPVLRDAADHFASGQVRNSATVGGNICNASPAGDTLVPLLVLDAQVELISKPDGAIQTRAVPLKDFFTGPGRSVRQPNELLAAVRVPLPPANFFARFHKFGTRPALDISAVSLGLSGVREGGRLTGVRVAFGAVAPTPIRGSRTEAVLEGKALDEATIAAAADAARSEVKPISDVRASAAYRRDLVHNLLKRMLADVA